MKLKSLLLGSAAGFVAIPGAHAADLPLKAAAAPVAVPAASWQGWYAGIHLGAASVGGDNWGYDDVNQYGSRGTVFIGGGQLGYNWQNGNFVYGWEGDISGLTDSHVNSLDSCCSGQYGNNINWLSTIRGRMGLAVGNTMGYVTAGVAVGGVDNTQHFSFGDYSNSKTRWGWAVGGGIEHMWNSKWTIGLEALYVDLGTYTTSYSGGKSVRYSNDAIIGRFKVNYKF